MLVYVCIYIAHMDLYDMLHMLMSVPLSGQKVMGKL